MVTAYDYPSAVHVDSAGMDMILVGDSAAMVVHGHDTTLPITLEEMLVHCRAVCRGSRRCLVVGDLPFGSFESSPAEAVRTAVRFMKEGGVDAVKIECGPPSRVVLAKTLVEAGIAVMGHIGLTPQAVSVIGGFRPQAQVAQEAEKLVEQALELEKAGCFGIVLECVPGPVAAAVTRAIRVPTIGIGAGPACSGQVLVYHDLLGMLSHPHHAKVAPKFCRRFAEVGREIERGLTDFREAVVKGEFPAGQFSPYRMAEAETAALEVQLRAKGLGEAADVLLAQAAAEDREKGRVPVKK